MISWILLYFFLFLPYFYMHYISMHYYIFLLNIKYFRNFIEYRHDHIRFNEIFFATDALKRNRRIRD